MINIKTPQEIAAMREGGKILGEILHELAITTKVGMTTGDINVKAEALMAKYKVAPSFKGYQGFPAVVCTSVNEENVHAIPGKGRLEDGDIISIDCGVVVKGFHTDAAVAVMLGNVDPKIRLFVETVQKSFDKGLKEIKPGAHTGDIGYAVQHVIEGGGYNVVRDYIGHGVGRALHEEPEVHNIGKKGKGVLLVPGMVIAVEPIIAMGERFYVVQPDQWTVVTRDGSPACQVEHTIAITPTGYEVLTKYGNTTNAIYSQ